MSPLTHYSFGSFKLYPSEHLLLRDNQAIPLAPKAFDVLLELVSNHGHLLTRETLIKTIWPDSFVEETNLTVNISLLRKALGEMEDGRPWIATAPKRGYRFEGSVILHHEAPPVVAPPVVAKVESALPAVEPVPHSEPDEAALVPPTPAGRPWFFPWPVASLAVILGLFALSHSDPVSQAYLARSYAASHREPEARKILVSLEQDSEERYISAAEIAPIYLALGDHDVALRWVGKAFDERAGSLIYMNVDRAYDPLRNDPRFLVELKRANLVPRADETASR